MFEVLLQVAAAMRAGLAVTIAPHHMLLSTQEAADLLRISRTTLVRLLETGAIPFQKPNRHRRVRLDDLLEYRRRQRSAAELALADMIADTERLGLYGVDSEDVRAALRATRKEPGGSEGLSSSARGRRKTRLTFAFHDGESSLRERFGTSWSSRSGSRRTRH